MSNRLRGRETLTPLEAERFEINTPHSKETHCHFERHFPGPLVRLGSPLERLSWVYNKSYRGKTMAAGYHFTDKHSLPIDDNGLIGIKTRDVSSEGQVFCPYHCIMGPLARHQAR